IDDPVLAALLREKQEELDRRLTMLYDRGTPRFLWGSLQLYGRPDAELVRLARELLAHTPPGDDEHDPDAPDDGPARVDAAGFMRRAREEFAAYRQQRDDFPDVVEVRDDVTAGAMVSRGRLLINATFLT